MKSKDQEDVIRTLKDRLETPEQWIEARTQGEDIHILVGRRDGSRNKVHLVIDGRTAEIRVKDDETAPLELIRSIESSLTLSDGRVVRFTRQVIDKRDLWQDKRDLWQESIESYGASVIQTGGIGSRFFTRTAWLLTEHAYIDPERFVRVAFNGGGDVMWVSPAEGFSITSFTSPTGNELLGHDQSSRGVLLKDQLKNEVSLSCKKIGTE